MKKKKILIIYTGGTIGMTEQSKDGLLVPFDFHNIIENIPELLRITDTIDIAPFSNPLDSSDINADVWKKMAELVFSHYHQYDGFVILHGTDTMAYSASAMSFMLQNISKPIIFTGSQLPIGKIRTDGKENLITAIEIACAEINDQPAIQEVAICFGSHLWRANRTTKFSAEGFEAFMSPNFPPLAEIGVHILFHQTQETKNNSALPLYCPALCTDISLIKLYPGIHEQVLDSFCNIPNLKGVILETFGSGTIPNHLRFLNSLKKLKEKGVFILSISQCAQGSVIPDLYKNSAQLQEIGAINGRDLTTEAAITKMMHVLALEETTLYKEQLMQSSIAGELSI